MFWALLITFLITQRKKIKSERIKAKISEWIRYIKHHFIIKNSNSMRVAIFLYKVVLDITNPF